MVKKKIKIAFVDFWEHWDPQDNFIVDVLREKYDVEISKEPDYIFYSNFNPFMEHMKYQDCVKIFYTQENLCPDFNFADYGIGFEYINFADRYLRYPICFIPKRYGNAWKAMKQKHLLIQKETDANRAFCSFVVSNDKANPIRKEAFEKLSTYRKVDSGGRYLNNVGMPNGVPDKLRFENNHKFSICFENSNHPGYMTEKIVEAFAARTIPIYWGDPLVTEVFNKDAFVNVNDFASVDDMVEYVKKIDQDDMMYMKMLGTPALNEANEYLWDEKQNELKNFLYNIFDQSMESAGRRNRVFWGELYWKNFDKMRRNYVVTHNNLASKLVRKGINRMKIIIKSTLRKGYKTR